MGSRASLTGLIEQGARRRAEGAEEREGKRAESSVRRTILSRDSIRDASARPLRHVTLQTVDNEAIVAA